MTRIVFSLALVCVPACMQAFAALPVLPAKDQAVFLKSSDPKLAANKKIAYDFFRIVLRAGHLDQAGKYMKTDYMQHNPNAETGLAGFKAYFTAVGLKPVEIKETLGDLVAIQAEGDHVTLSFSKEYDDPNNAGKKYTTTWFDMFRIDGGKIAEHWDSATMAVRAPAKGKGK
jgi:predicted SnoaL-like aldol condensation-catalyzing enzyme